MFNVDNSFALIVGIAAYGHLSPVEEAVRNDAADLQSLLVSPQYCGYKPENVYTLLDGDGTGSRIRQTIQLLGSRCGPESTVLIYFSCRAAQIDNTEYLLPVDADNTSEASLVQTFIPGRELAKMLKAVAARKSVVIFNCSHEAGGGQPKGAELDDLPIGLSDGFYKMFSTGPGRVVIAASRRDEVSRIMPGCRNSVFGGHLLDGLRGAALTTGGVIRIFDLFNYVREKVTAEHDDQHPIFKAELEDNFPLVPFPGPPLPRSLPAASGSTGFPNDVFISYKHLEPEKSWVRKQLVPRLEQEGIRVYIDYRDFRLGSPLVIEIEQAIERSRYTLAVLTPAYLESEFTELENVLAQHLGLETGQNRLLAICRTECRPRLSIRARIWLDMTRDEEFDAAIARLVFEINTIR